VTSEREVADRGWRRQLAAGHAFDAFSWQEVEVDRGDLALDMAVTPQVVNSAGALQGGLMATLADSVAGMALLRGDDPYQDCATSDLHISYLAGARVGPVRAVATVLRRGRRSAVVRVDLVDRGAGDLPVATATLTFSARRAPGPGGPTG
jgi:uncharacterized protein (TIGR00369 family)